MLGGVFGAVIYIIFIESHHSNTQPEEGNDAYEKYELANMD